MHLTLPSYKDFIENDNNREILMKNITSLTELSSFIIIRFNPWTSIKGSDLVSSIKMPGGKTEKIIIVVLNINNFTGQLSIQELKSFQHKSLINSLNLYIQ